MSDCRVFDTDLDEFINLSSLLRHFQLIFHPEMALSLQRYTWHDEHSPLTRFLKERLNREKERSMLIVMEKIDHLPENLIIEILSRLPVKDLLQFKSVCKSWYAIISSSNFVSKHLNNYYNNNDSWRGCLLAQYYITLAELLLYELLVDETPRVLADETIYSTMPMRGSYVCGPCDGLYYLNNYNYSLRALWNPALNELKFLPEIIFKRELPSNITYAPYEGSGLDPLTRDYKVVVINTYWSTNDKESTHPLSLHVYSVKTNSWRYCGDLSRAYDLGNNQCYMYVNGFFFWLGSYNYYSCHMIISFDMSTNAFEEMKLPYHAQPSSKCLGIYDDSLALLSLHETEKILDVWTFKEGSWTKKLTMGPLPNIWNPVGHWKDNFILLENKDCELVLIDPDSQELKNLGSQFDFKCQGVFAYMESLVSFEDSIKTGLLREDAYMFVDAESNNQA